MKMISTRKFHKLRLKDVLGRTDTDNVVSYEYLGKTWFGQTYGFSHALRLYSSPFKTKSVAIAPNDVKLEKLTFLLGKDLSEFHRIEDCNSTFGEPIMVEEFAEDRKTCTYFVENESSYELGFTIRNVGGLEYFTMETSDIAYNKPRL